MTVSTRVLLESIVAALACYLLAGATEATLLRTVQPTEWQLAWVSDLVLSIALGVAVYLWRHLSATRAALAARERAELVLEAQLSVAADIQRRLLPDIPAASRGTEWAASLVSAGKIGGDFYDFVELDGGRWLVLVADVSGKGVPAALAIGTLKTIFRGLAREQSAPAALMALLSRRLYAEWAGQPYVTGLIARVDPHDRLLTWANAGHPSGLVLRSGTVEYLESLGPPVGLLAEGAYGEGTVTLRAGDVCVFVSDGVTEALDDGRGAFADIISALAQRHGASARRLCDAVMAEARAAHGPPDVADWQDDRTVVVVRISAG